MKIMAMERKIAKRKFPILPILAKNSAVVLGPASGNVCGTGRFVSSAPDTTIGTTTKVRTLSNIKDVIMFFISVFLFESYTDLFKTL